MKKTAIILFSILALSKITYAQNTFPPSGNVGIGTTSPATALDVNGAISIKGINVNDTQAISVPTDGTYVIASGARIKGTYTITFEAANRVQTAVLLANATQYDYNSSLSILSNTYYNNTPVLSNFRYVFSSDNSVVYLVFSIANRNGGSSVTAHFDGTGAYIPSWGGTLPASPTTAGIYPMVINSGNVGIGMANPQNKLDVNGTIHAKAVQIDLNGWADYVFKKGYQLPSLNVVKSYIDKNQHLPEFPSEQEMIKSGLNVGEMNKLLMRKVEELTLYLIEKDKTINEQQKKLSDQELINKVSEERLKRLESLLPSLKTNR